MSCTMAYKCSSKGSLQSKLRCNSMLCYSVVVGSAVTVAISIERQSDMALLRHTVLHLFPFSIAGFGVLPIPLGTGSSSSGLPSVI